MRLAWLTYVLPSLLVVIIGLATCSLIDVTDFDRFHVEASVPDDRGARHAVAVRHWHADSSATVKCVWVLAGPAPRPGPSPRLASTCALVATDPDAPIEVRWLPNGRLRAKLAPGTTASKSESNDWRCYFDQEALGKHVCYRAQQVEIDQ